MRKGGSKSFLLHKGIFIVCFLMESRPEIEPNPRTTINARLASSHPHIYPINERNGETLRR